MAVKRTPQTTAVLSSIDVGSCAAAAAALQRGTAQMRRALGSDSPGSCVSVMQSVDGALRAMDRLARALSDHAVTMMQLRCQERELLDQLAAAGLRARGAQIVVDEAGAVQRVGRVGDPADVPGSHETDECVQRWVQRLHMLRTNRGYAASRLRHEAAAARDALEALGLIEVPDGPRARGDAEDQLSSSST